MSNTETQSEALELAEFFGSMKKSSHRWHDGVPVHEKAAAELRRLDAENKALREKLEASPIGDDREAFEAWAKSQPMILDLTPRGDGYAGAFAQTTWMGWKARGEALATRAAAKNGGAA